MTSDNAGTFFSEIEKGKISALVKNAERETSGEIAVMVVDASDSYREAGFLGALLLSAFISLVCAVSLHLVTIWSYIPAVMVFWFPALYLMRRFPRFKLTLAGRTRLEEAVRDRAVRAFFEKELYRTREETGVLIFISTLEHKVWILGDRRINEQIGPELWQELSGALAAKISEDQAFEGMRIAIDRLSAILKKHFPPAADDSNELPDEVIVAE